MTGAPKSKGLDAGSLINDHQRSVFDQNAISADDELELVARWFEEQDPTGQRFAIVLRTAFDEALDGGRTGRFDPSTLRKVEKTFIGTRVEMGIAREFGLPDGDAMDFSVLGIDVDAKYSGLPFGWQLPPEALGHLCLVIWSDDRRSLFSIGLIRVQPGRLGAPNRDQKSPLNALGRQAIRWIQRDAALPENLLLHLGAATRAAIFAHSNGQARVDELFRRVQRRRIWREAIVTVARQTDPARRVRTARERRHLGVEGIVVLGQYGAHQLIADALGLPIPHSGEWVSARLSPIRHEDGRRFVSIDGELWGVAHDNDPIVAAPAVPHSPDADV